VLERHVGTGSKPPKLAVVIEVQEAFLHCAAAMLRSSLWKPETWPSLDGLPSPARIWKDHAAAPVPVEQLEAELIDGYANDRDW